MEQVLELDALLGSSVAAIEAKLGELTPAGLIALRELEAGKVAPRSTLLAAIDRELEGRAGESAGAGDGTGDGAGEGEGEGAGENAGDGVGEDAGAAVADRGMEMQVLSLADTLANLGFVVPEGLHVCEAAKVQLRELVARVAELEAVPVAAAPIALALPKKPKPLEPAAYTVVFGDSAGDVIADLPKLTFPASCFLPKRDALALGEAVEFPVHGKAEMVHSAWLVNAAGKAVARCGLLSPMAIGGGRSAKIPAGYLAFRAN